MAQLLLGSASLHRANYADAYELFKRTPLDTNPSLWAFQMATTLFHLGRDDEASGLVENYLRVYPKDEGGVGMSVKAMMLAKSGKSSESKGAIQRAYENGKSFGHFHHTAYNIAVAYALMNQPDEALKWLQAAADEGFPCYPLFENDENLNSIRKDPRFIDFMTALRANMAKYKDLTR